MNAVSIKVRGTVQGVGFRPFVYRIATEAGLRGFVRNTPTGVEIRVEGENGFRSFLDRLRREMPPLARIDHMQVRKVPPLFVSEFHIDTTRDGGSTVFAPADLFMCDACRAELQDPNDRRYRYPFINCTNCGPRYTLLLGLPYDREKTTMRVFPMCPDCQTEYESPSSRRFHAEPNACPTCGPEITFVDFPLPAEQPPPHPLLGKEGATEIEKTVASLREGKIVALKSLGGFHLICDPFQPGAVTRLRELKKRSRKPLALMARDATVIEKLAYVSADELDMLASPQRPIVLLRKKKEIDGLSPNLDTYGIMLPYTPLHALLLQEIPLVVATSANERDGPILKDEGEELAITLGGRNSADLSQARPKPFEATQRGADPSNRRGAQPLADCMLTHNRPIANRCDDSVVRVCRGGALFLRRARGYVPDPLWLPDIREPKSILALGAEMKNTVTLFKDGYLITSQYLGDMKDVRNLAYMDEALEKFRELFSADPALVCCDLHPRFTTTRLAEGTGKPVIRVQHHLAHVFAVMAEHGLDPRGNYLGVAFDGMGYGDDGCVWGGEFLALSDGRTQQRWHLRYVPQPGGDLAAREPWRMELSYLRDATGEIPRVGVLQDIPEAKIRAVTRALEVGINAPPTSSVGRLFDAVAALVGVAPDSMDYEAEAAMRLECAVEPSEQAVYSFSIAGEEIDVREMIREILRSGEPPGVVAAKFHNTVASVIARMAEVCREIYGIGSVLLSGGVFLNAALLERTFTMLEEKGFTVHYPRRLSPGDEAISVGQALYAVTQGN
ncbi:MAG: carbamoyltransferase HypF [Candidatus Binatia bacterium]|jgi:hydrogenase maturation protein HypF